MLVLRRFLPFLVGALNALCLFWQAGSPGTYPWIAAIAPVAFLAVGFFIGAKRLPWQGLVARLLPPTLAIIVAAFGLLLFEGSIARWGVPIFVGGVSVIALELLFLLAFLPTRYPVNGLSRLNLCLVPIVLWLANDASVGLTMFIHASRLIPIVVLSVIGALLFWATAHLEDAPEHRKRWSLLGGWLGAHIGLLGAFLPLQVSVHGSYAALLATLALRSRRYGMMPRLPRGLVWGEIGGVLLLLIAVFATARWV